MITPAGVSRRLQALAAMGHPDGDVANWLQVGVEDLRAWQQDATLIDETAQQVVLAVFQRESFRPGRSEEARLRAWHAGWVTAAGWDDIDTDPAPAGTTPPFVSTLNLATANMLASLVARGAEQVTHDVQAMLAANLGPDADRCMVTTRRRAVPDQPGRWQFITTILGPAEAVHRAVRTCPGRVVLHAPRHERRAAAVRYQPGRYVTITQVR